MVDPAEPWSPELSCVVESGACDPALPGSDEGGPSGTDTGGPSGTDVGGPAEWVGSVPVGDVVDVVVVVDPSDGRDTVAHSWAIDSLPAFAAAASFGKSACECPAAVGLFAIALVTAVQAVHCP